MKNRCSMPTQKTPDSSDLLHQFRATVGTGCMVVADSSHLKLLTNQSETVLAMYVVQVFSVL